NAGDRHRRYSRLACDIVNRRATAAATAWFAQGHSPWAHLLFLRPTHQCETLCTIEQHRVRLRWRIQPMANNALPRFHLAFPVQDLSEARRFYGGLLGCPEGRSSAEWVDFDFHGHQIVAHLCAGRTQAAVNQVDGEDVPVRHFGVILSLEQWKAL